MIHNDRLIMVIDGSARRAQCIKELIEFMDAPAVRTATPQDWRSRMGKDRLAAVFLSKEIPEPEMTRLIGEVERIDPNVPLVLVNGDEDA